jgi:hypothetical protein
LQTCLSKSFTCTHNGGEYCGKYQDINEHHLYRQAVSIVDIQEFSFSDKYDNSKWLPVDVLIGFLQKKRDLILDDASLEPEQKNMQLALIFEFLEELRRC